jgi:hypothetical protein
VSSDRLLRTLVCDGLSQNPDFPIISSSSSGNRGALPGEGSIERRSKN